MWKGVFLSVGTWAVLAVGLRAAIVSPEMCPAVTATEALAGAEAAARWIEAAQNPDGTYVYQYFRETGETSSADYNLIRHAGVTMSLYQYAAAGNEWALGPGDLALGYMVENLTRRDDWAAFAPEGENAALGASALMLAGLAERRTATGDEQFDELMREVGRFLLVMQEPDGSMLARWQPLSGMPIPDQKSRYYTGEAFWALAQMHNHFPGEGWDPATYAVADYLSTRRDEAEGYEFPPWADQWAGYGFAEMASWPVDEVTIPYAESLAERFGFLVRVESRRTDGQLSLWLHGRNARAAGLGTWVEGLNGLHTLAANDPRLSHIRDDVAERIACSAGMLADRQVSAEEGAAGVRPEFETGAWFTNGVTRMDDQQHALSGLLLSVPVLEAMGRE